MKSIIVCLIASLFLASCGSKNESHTGRNQPLAAKILAERSPSDREQFLAYEHSLSVDTDEAGVKPLFDRITSACLADKESGCTVLDSNLESGRSPRASIKLRAKAESIRNLIQLAGSSGEIVEQSTHVEDIARPVIDNAKHREMLAQYQKKLLELEQKAGGNIDTLIKVSKELATLQSELESAAGEHAHLIERVNKDILHVHIEARINRGFWAPIRNSLGEFSANLSNGISGAIVAIPYIIPWIFILGIAGFVIRKAWRKFKS